MKDHSENRTENRTNNCKNQSQNRTTTSYHFLPLQLNCNTRNLKNQYFFQKFFQNFVNLAFINFNFFF